MRHIISIIILLLTMPLGACDQQHKAESIAARDGSTGGTEGSTTIAEATAPPCECDPVDPNACGVGLQCVPIGGVHACLAVCSALTTCGGECFYPFASENGTGRAFCSTCVTCAPIEALTCQ